MKQILQNIYLVPLDKGWVAARLGDGKGQCPYGKFSIARLIWLYGYNFG